MTTPSATIRSAEATPTMQAGVLYEPTEFHGTIEWGEPVTVETDD